MFVVYAVREARTYVVRQFLRSVRLLWIFAAFCFGKKTPHV
jgi:hypothetical protein